MEVSKSDSAELWSMQDEVSICTLLVASSTSSTNEA